MQETWRSKPREEPSGTDANDKSHARFAVTDNTLTGKSVVQISGANTELQTLIGMTWCKRCQRKSKIVSIRMDLLTAELVDLREVLHLPEARALRRQLPLGLVMTREWRVSTFLLPLGRKMNCQMAWWVAL